MQTYERNKTLFGILAAMLIIGAIFWIVKYTRPLDLVDTVMAQPVDGESVLNGTLACLSLKNGDTPLDESCVMGLIGEDNKSYALDSTQITIVSKTIEVQDRVRVVGVVSAPNTSVDEGNAFKIDGVIKMRAMQKAEQAN